MRAGDDYGVVWMPRTPVSQVGRVTFELDHFRLIGGERCELQGRWFGVRGRRFMRPALTIVVDGQTTRLLADLAGKPWAAEDGQPWTAAFPCSLAGGDVVGAELTVSNDVTVSLPAPQGAPAARRKKGTGTRRSPAVAATDTGQTRAQATPTSSRTTAALQRERAGALETQRRLERDLERAEVQRERAETERAQAAADSENVTSRLTQVTRERDTAQRAADETAQALQQAITARDEAIADRDRALAERGSALSAQTRAEADRDAALAQRDQAQSEQAAALSVRDHALAERDAVATERDAALAERDAALAARDAATAERDNATAARDQARTDRDNAERISERLQSELTEVMSAKAAAMVMRRAAAEPLATRPLAAAIPLAISAIAIVAIIVVILKVAGVL